MLFQNGKFAWYSLGYILVFGIFCLDPPLAVLPQYLLLLSLRDKSCPNLETIAPPPSRMKKQGGGSKKFRRGSCAIFIDNLRKIRLK